MFHVKHFNMNEYLSTCPVCGGNQFHPYLEVTDHFLSGEKFSICSCSSCGFRFINPRPTSQEIAKYYQSEAYISHNASGFNLVTTMYKLARFFAIRGKYRLIKSRSNGKRILDIGCGTGEVLKYCRQKGYIVQGVEPTDAARKFANESNGLDVRSSLKELGKPLVSYNCITLWHVLEHIHDLNINLVQIREMLDKDGTLIIAVPNSNSMDAREYGEKWAAYDVPRHLYHFTNETIHLLAEKHGFVVEKIVPQKLDSYYVSLLSEKYRSGRSNLLMAFYHGFRSNFVARRMGYGHSSLIFLLSLKKV
jgi:2-polyprenyl-3-methyl-5-hydroxy-6-metoxy-1,4-benzoquinol methylase